MPLPSRSQLVPSAGELSLSPGELALAERIAAEVASRLAGEPGAERTKLLDAGEVSRILGCERSWVYEHQAELGVIHLGNSSKPRLRFEPARVAEIASAPRAELRREPQRAIPRRRLIRRSTVPLLEIKGRR